MRPRLLACAYAGFVAYLLGGAYLTKSSLALREPVEIASVTKTRNVCGLQERR